MISILGSTSFLAKKLIDHLLKNGSFEIQKYCRDPKVEEKLFSFPVVGIDSLNIEELLRSEVIVYAAGAGIQPMGRDTDNIILELNTFEPIRLIEKLNYQGYQGKLITFGSYFEIGNHFQEKEYTEEQLAKHDNSTPNIYCESKRKLTKYIHCNQHSFNFTHIHIILTNIYGKGENENRLLPYLINSFRTIKDVSLTSGTQVRQYTHITDVNRFLMHLIESDIKSMIVNFTNPELISVKHLVQEFASLSNFPKSKLKFESEIRRDVSMNHLALDMNHFFKRFGRFKFIPLSEGLLEYLD